MDSIYSELLNSLKVQLEAHPFTEFKRGELKAFITKNANDIKKASVIYTQKTIIEKLASDLNIDIKYQYVNHVLKNINTTDFNETQRKKLDIKQTHTTDKHQRREDKERDPIVTEDETDALGRKPYPVDNEITAEKIAEWAHLKLPNFAVRKLISFRISIEEWKALNYTIKSADSINAFVANYCQKKEDDWLESQRNKNT